MKSKELTRAMSGTTPIPYKLHPRYGMGILSDNKEFSIMFFYHIFPRNSPSFNSNVSSQLSQAINKA